MIREEDKVQPGHSAKNFRQSVWLYARVLTGKEPDAVTYTFALGYFSAAGEHWCREMGMIFSPATEERIRGPQWYRSMVTVIFWLCTTVFMIALGSALWLHNLHMAAVMGLGAASVLWRYYKYVNR